MTRLLKWAAMGAAIGATLGAIQGASPYYAGPGYLCSRTHCLLLTGGANEEVVYYRDRAPGKRIIRGSDGSELSHAINVRLSPDGRTMRLY